MKSGARTKEEAPEESRVPRSTADQLHSWKEIAAFLKRDVSTVQRWEKREGMPVHRHQHAKSSSVFAFRSELEAWWQNGHGRLDASGARTAGEARAVGRPPWIRRIGGGVGLAAAIVGLVVAAFYGSRASAPSAPRQAAAAVAPPDVSAAKANPEAYQQYLRGQLHCSRWSPEDFEKGVRYLEESIRLRPGYAPTFRALAGCYGAAAYFGFQPPAILNPRRRWAVNEAARASGRTGEPDQLLAGVAFYEDWDWTATERAFRSALALNPDHTQSHQVYAWYLAAMGRSAEAIAHAEEASRLDPLGVAPQLAMCSVAWFAGQYDRAVSECRRAVDQESSNAVARAYLGWALLLQGSKGEALGQLETAKALAPDNPFTVTLLAYGLADADRSVDAKKMLHDIQAMSLRRYVSSYYLALIHTALGEHDVALDRLEQAHAERAPWMVWLKVDPRLDPLRVQPRFRALIERMAFP